MIRAELVLDGIRDLATVASGPTPKVGELAGALGRVENAAIGIDGGRFVYVGPSRHLRRELRVRSGGRRIHLPEVSVVPGFVDAHTHLLFAGDRAQELGPKVHGASYLEIARRGGGLLSTVRATRRATSSDLAASAEARLRRLLARGTTTAEVKSGYALTHAGELRLLELLPGLARRTGVRIVPTYLGAHAVPPGIPKARYVSSIVTRSLPEVARRGLAAFCDVFCEPGFFSVPDADRILRAAARLGLGTKLHAEEFVRSGGALLAARRSCRSADHLLASTAEDRRALARAGVAAVLLPVTALATMSGRASPGRALVDDGVAVALGSDLSPNSWVESMSTVLNHAVYSARLTPAEALVAATANSAWAIGVDDRAGVIAVDRPADLVAFDLPSVEHVPYRWDARPWAVYRRGIRVSSG